MIYDLLKTPEAQADPHHWADNLTWPTGVDLTSDMLTDINRTIAVNVCAFGDQSIFGM